MSLLKIKSKCQVTLPLSLRRQLGWNIGDSVYAFVEQDQIVFTSSLECKGMEAISISIRQRFQFTLPKKICNKFGLHEGDMLEAIVDCDSLIFSPRILLVPYHHSSISPLEGLSELENEFKVSERLLSLSKKKM